MIKIIKWLQTNNDHLKFMGMSGMMNYILSENKRLNLQVHIKIEDYLMGRVENFKKYLDVVDLFYL